MRNAAFVIAAAAVLSLADQGGDNAPLVAWVRAVVAIIVANVLLILDNEDAD